MAPLSWFARLTGSQEKLSGRLMEQAREHEQQGGGHQPMSMTVEGGSWRERLVAPEMRVRVAQNVAMDWPMLWKDLLAGFLIVLPLLDICRRDLGWRMALHIGAVFHAALLVDLASTALGIVPAVWLFVLNHRQPLEHQHQEEAQPA